MQDALYTFVRQHDYEHYIATLLTKDTTQRHHIMAVFAFTAEIKRIPSITHEPMTGYVRLAWWRERIEDIYIGKNVRGQETLAALQPFIEQCQPPKELFLSIIEEAAALLEADGPHAPEKIGAATLALITYVYGNPLLQQEAEKVGNISGKLEAMKDRAFETPENFLENLVADIDRIDTKHLRPYLTLAFLHYANKLKTVKYRGLANAGRAQPGIAKPLNFLPLRALLFSLLTLK